jgi:hypothetical protein
MEWPELVRLAVSELRLAIGSKKSSAADEHLRPFSKTRLLHVRAESGLGIDK